MSSAMDARARLRAVRMLRRATPAGFERPSVKADINVTPLVDVVLVLLIIFMVVTPLIASGVAVDLPRTTHHQRKPDDGKDIIVSVTREGKIFVGTRPLAKLADLGGVITAEQRKFPDKAVFLKGDARARYGAVREAMHALHEANIADIVLGTEERTQEPGK